MRPIQIDFHANTALPLFVHTHNNIRLFWKTIYIQITDIAKIKEENSKIVNKFTFIPSPSHWILKTFFFLPKNIIRMEIIISNFDISNMNGNDSLILIACVWAGKWVRAALRVAGEWQTIYQQFNLFRA